MLTIIAWRNVWRNKGRSGVVIGAMVVGIWALSFGSGFMQSFLIGYIESAIRYETSNGQIHHPSFMEDQDIKFTIGDPLKVVAYLKEQSAVRGICARSLVNGMISSARQATGVRIVGVNPVEEADVTHLDSLIADGEYFSTVLSNPVLIGEKLAEKLKVKVKAKVVLTFQDANGNITAGRFRVAGILHAASLVINESSAYVRKDDLNRLLNINAAIHEIAYITNPGTDDQALADQLNKKFPNEKTSSWQELSPALVFMQQWMGAILKVLIVVIMTALAFGIVNTMLMAVLERIRELGVLMALGMNRGRVFLMIMMETIFLTTIGGPLGLIAGYATISYLGEKGIDLSSYSEGLEAIGYESVLYPSLGTTDYIQIVVGVLITAILASIYPAWKAIQYNPVEAIHTL
ncbi:MAG: FtsX-like permease family protein [Cyclobacteriaceae bacterium]|nr:FtsX-like permease family protein [Cyclobacteriaceae bacterium]MDH4297391.1 FtsX-like permease family protein [Cyclobacteriaceae bacterium]MDH5248558.1 FtsX-like permease family protein [Cyclobacteriaceae bacterium]